LRKRQVPSGAPKNQKRLSRPSVTASGRVRRADLRWPCAPAAREIERIFSGFEHARSQYSAGVGIGVAHGFVSAEISVVVLLAGFVVAQELRCKTSCSNPE